MDFGISVMLGALTVFGVIGALAFFGYNIHRIMTLMPAILGLAFFIAAIPITLSVMTIRKTTYVSNANPKNAEIVKVETKRIGPETVEISVSLSVPARILLQYKGPGRDFIIPITPVGGSAARNFHVFNLPKTDTAPGTVIFDLEGEDRLYNGSPLIIY